MKVVKTIQAIAMILFIITLYLHLAGRMSNAFIFVTLNGTVLVTVLIEYAYYIYIKIKEKYYVSS